MWLAFAHMPTILGTYFFLPYSFLGHLSVVFLNDGLVEL